LSIKKSKISFKNIFKNLLNIPFYSTNNKEDKNAKIKQLKQNHHQHKPKKIIKKRRVKRRKQRGHRRMEKGVENLINFRILIRI